ncbi:hypothetical protein [Limosilactobacillus albertensis]|uniref:Uncharacterized protein n=1 Tax=Limosilactobacillus albertensis TaxID=2759752 RepID=A0A839H5Y7_9LACO|nr:hypothetical protein [Limosilactobacillus albertensis]MBB1124130.1 hypothetical protein [Limosilactobacillus albertensis]MCD7122082.1 hypothetical protein [Limosilactobacillus albertensis]
MNDRDNNIGIGKYSWSYIIKWLFIVLLIYGLGSILLANPFSMFNSYTGPVSYSKVMYFHGLTVGLAGLLALFVSQVLNLSNLIKKIIFYFTVATIILGTTGGAINRSMTNTKVTLWYQVLSFFALDVVLITLLVGLITTKNKRLKNEKGLYYIAISGSAATVIGGLFGDLSGFILDFGNWPGICGWYANKIGYSLAEWKKVITTSHYDNMFVGLLSLMIAVFIWQYGQCLAKKANKTLIFFEYWTFISTVLTIVMYVVQGIGGTKLVLPNLFTAKGIVAQTNSGVSSGDMAKGLVIIGGLVILSIIVFGERQAGKNLDKTAKLTTSTFLLIWSFIAVILMGFGFFQQFHRTWFRSLINAPHAAYGFAFRNVHLNIAILLMPYLIVFLFFSSLILKNRFSHKICLFARGIAVLWFIGSCIYVLFVPSPFGPGYWFIAAGVVMLILSVVYFFINDKEH